MNARTHERRCSKHLLAPDGARRAARALALAAGLAVGAACADPSLHVIVEQPANASELSGLVGRVEITVYERDGLRCDDIAFGKLSADEQRAIERSRGEGSLTQIPRLGQKAVVARGYGAPAQGTRTERLIVAGCAEVGEIADDERVVVQTEAVAYVAIDSSLVPSGNGAVEIAVVAVDARQKGIDGKQVSWTTYGPMPASGAAELEPTTPAALSSGEGTLRPPPPAMVGPYAVQIRVKWAAAQPPAVTSTMATLPVQRTLGVAEPAFLNTCAIYQLNGRPTLACLERDGAGARSVRSYRLAGGQLVSAGLPQAATPNAVAILGAGTELVQVNADGSYASLFGSSYAGTVCAGACGAATLIDVIGFAGCPAAGGAAAAGVFAYYREAAVPRLVGTVLATNKKQAFLTPPDPTLTLGAIGCVTDLETGARPQVAATVNIATTNLLYLFDQQFPIERRRDRRLYGTGFAPPGKESPEARLLTTELDATGFVVVESVLAKPGVAYRLFERRRSAAVAPPAHYVSGQLDADGEADLAWDLEDTTSGTRGVQLLLGARPGRPTLSGRLPLTDTADLLAADLDGDGVAEIIGYSNNSVSVLRLGAL